MTGEARTVPRPAPAEPRGASLSLLPLGLAAAALLGAVVFPLRGRPGAPPPSPEDTHELPAETPIGPSLLRLTLPPDPARAYEALPRLRFANLNSGEAAVERIYGADGALDEGSLSRLDHALADARLPVRPYPEARLDRRLMQLVARAAYHFGAPEVTVVSAYRKPRRAPEGLHGEGRAIDFRLDGVSPGELAAYLRTAPRAGVGLYPHPRTQFVHLDVRPQSYHWVDGSGPGRRGGEWSLGARGLAALDERACPRDDRPEGQAFD